MADDKVRLVKPGTGTPGRMAALEDVSTRERDVRPRMPAVAGLVLAGLERLGTGTLTVRLPNGASRTFGAGDAPHTEVTVRRWRFFSRLIRGADVGAGESYVDGDWSTPDLVSLTRLFLANEDVLAPPRLVGLAGRIRDRVLHLLRSNTRRQAPRNIHAHYDLSNEFYGLFLDPTMTYSAARFERPGLGLEEAQRAKYRRLAEWAGLHRGDHVLEIGCGWGGFAEFAAGELECRVTGITLSEEQARFASRRLQERGLADLATIRLVDYRDVEGSFDGVVSIEMLEAVGHRYLDAFFAVCDRVLKPGGRVALQTISIPDQAYDRYRRGTDWIRRYIFPGGHLPSLGALQASMARRTSFAVDRLENISDHYAATLRQWRRRFWNKIADVRALGFDERFVRTWDFYLATCEAAFLERQIGNLQLQLSRTGKDGRRDPSRSATS